MFNTSREELLTNKRKFTRQLLAITRKERNKSILICRHNTILALTTDGEVTHIVDLKENRNLVCLYTLNEHLAVPRWEPKVAKLWLNEDLELSNTVDGYTPNMKKVLLSESELRTLVKKETIKTIEFYNQMLSIDTIKKQRGL